MNILFATLVDVNSLSECGIYQDLMREIAMLGHKIYIVSPAERRYNKATAFTPDDMGGVLKVRVGNIQKTGKLEKGISTLLLENQYVSAVKKHFRDVKFDLVIYSTPPITLEKLIKFVKARDGAISYLLLKDIFPQNAADLGILSEDGIAYRFFRNKEKRLYGMSDHIGCMSLANVRYLLSHNPQIDESKVHVCPNSITPMRKATKTVADEAYSDKVSKESCKNRAEIRTQYGIPQNSKLFVYGGNLGQPQCTPFIAECLRQNQDKTDRYFLICGEGTQAGVLEAYIRDDRPGNVKLLELLPKDTYDELLSACDIGLIFLDHRFTIPNFPSRLLSYMERELPVFSCTDKNTDIGEIITENGFGWWCESDNPNNFTKIADEICNMEKEDLVKMGVSAHRYLENNYKASTAAKTILQAASLLTK